MANVNKFASYQNILLTAKCQASNEFPFLALQQFREHNPVLAQFYVQPKKGEMQTGGGRGPGEAFLSFSVALWIVGYVYVQSLRYV